MTVEKLTNRSASQVSDLLKWWAKQHREIQLEAMSEADMVKLLRQVERIKNKFDMRSKRLDRNIDELSETEKMKIAALKKGSRRRPKVKAEQIKKHAGLIRRLKHQGLGFHMIAKYLKEYHDVQVTPAYLHKVCRELGIKGEA